MVSQRFKVGAVGFLGKTKGEPFVFGFPLFDTYPVILVCPPFGDTSSKAFPHFGLSGQVHQPFGEVDSR